MANLVNVSKVKVLAEALRLGAKLFPGLCGRLGVDAVTPKRRREGDEFSLLLKATAETLGNDPF